MSDVYRGVPSAYADFVGYDEVAHHSGLFAPTALDTLRRLDRSSHGSSTPSPKPPARITSSCCPTTARPRGRPSCSATTSRSRSSSTHSSPPGGHLRSR